jgi:putative ATP-dependent endonuclease of OLD family
MAIYFRKWRATEDWETNLFRAIRLLLDDNMRRSAMRLDERDFHRGLGDWRGHWIIISLEFDEVSQDEAIQSLFFTAPGTLRIVRSAVR